MKRILNRHRSGWWTGWLLLSLLALVCVVTTGCDTPSTTTTGTTARTLFQDPITATLVELPLEAIPTWRKHSDSKPALVLFSDDPMLRPVSPETRAEINNLLNSATEAEIRQKGPFSPGTLFQPTQTLSAALHQGFFSEIVWVTSKSVDSKILSGTDVADTLFRIGAIDDYERESFGVSEFGLKGSVYDTPLQIVYRDRIPNLGTSTILHFDLSFFRGLYENEIKTPFFKTLKSLAVQLRTLQYRNQATTISFSNLSQWVRLELRFIGHVIKELLANPTILDAEQPPQAWQRKSRSLYLEVFFQNEERAALFMPLVKENPNQSADTYWELYITSIKFASFDEAISYLEQAVARDPAYAVEYFDLAAKALQRGLPEMAAAMWQKAAAAFPNNPFIKLQEIKARIVIGTDPSEIRPELERLRQLPWSEAHNKAVRSEIEAMLKNLK